MIVVANTSPLTNLAAISQLDLLHQLYGQLHIAIVQCDLYLPKYLWIFPTFRSEHQLSVAQFRPVCP